MAKQLTLPRELTFSEENKQMIRIFLKDIKPEDHFEITPMNQSNARRSVHLSISILALILRINKEEVVDAILTSFFEKEFGMKIEKTT